MRTLLVAAFGLSLIPSSARADLAPPVPPAKDVKFVVELDEKAKSPKLIVPQNLTTVRVRPRPGGPGAAPPKAGALPPAKDGNNLSYIEIESDDETPLTQPRNNNHLMIAGVALTLALGFGGVWLVRRQGRSGMRGLALLIAAGGTLAASTIVWANVPPPKFPDRPPVKERVILPVAFDGNVNLEVTFGGDTIRLILDKDTYEKLKKDPVKPAK